MQSFLNDIEYYYLESFEFENGEVLENVKVEYVTGGTPKYDDKGRIVNAILYCHGSGGNCCSIKKLCDLTGEGEPFDSKKYFFISMSILGSPNSCSPSTTDLYYDFPEYSILDMVNFQKKFLNDCFSINHLKGIIGNSMGGYVALTWAVSYPNFMDFIIPIVSSYKNVGHNYILSKVIKDLITSNPDYNIKKQSESLTNTLKLCFEVEYSYGFSREKYRSMSNKELNFAIGEYANESLSLNVYDVKYQNDAVLEYDIEEDLDLIIADVLIIAINQDQYFPPELDAVPLSKLIKNSKLVCFNSIWGHVGSNELIKIRDELSEFMSTYV